MQVDIWIFPEEDFSAWLELMSESSDPSGTTVQTYQYYITLLEGAAQEAIRVQW